MSAALLLPLRAKSKCPALVFPSAGVDSDFIQAICPRPASLSCYRPQHSLNIYNMRFYLRAYHMSQSFATDVTLGNSTPQEALQRAIPYVSGHCSAGHLAVLSVVITRHSLTR